MRAAIYARVSTANNGQDPRVQTRELQEYCQRRGWVVAGEYVDVGISGTKEKRPELDRLLPEWEALLPDTGWCPPLRHPSHPRAWGWRAVQSELGDGIS